MKMENNKSYQAFYINQSKQIKVVKEINHA